MKKLNLTLATGTIQATSLVAFGLLAACGGGSSGGDGQDPRPPQPGDCPPALDQQGGAWTTFCAGDGSGVACPCGNNGAPGRGCGTSISSSGAVLNGLGVASTNNDTFVLSLANAPIGVAALFFQGTSASGGGAGVVFGDGVRCVSGSIIRLGIKTTTNGGVLGGIANYPSAGDASITTRGAVPATGGVRLYQAWFRNSAPYCTASTFNLSNGLRVTWLP